MPTLSAYPKQKIAITFPTTQLNRAREKARQEFGFNVPELLRHLMANYLQDAPAKSSRERLSPKAEERLTKEVEAFYKNDFKGSKSYTSAQELIQALETDD